MEDFGRTRVCSVLFLDIVDYSRRDVAEQVRLKNIFNLVMTSALGHVEPEERVVVDTGDGAAITFLGDPERARCTWRSRCSTTSASFRCAWASTSARCR